MIFVGLNDPALNLGALPPGDYPMDSDTTAACPSVYHLTGLFSAVPFH